MSQQAIKELFFSFDKNDDGSISTEELDALFKSMGMVLTKAERIEAMHQLDTDNTGKIEWAEFKQFLLGAV